MRKIASVLLVLLTTSCLTIFNSIADDSSHKLCGSFKIMSDGIITRFTGLSKADWNSFMNSAEAEYKAKYSETETAQAPATEKVAV